LAFEAFETDIGANSHYLPFIAAAGVWFAQPDYIAELYAYSHRGCSATPPVITEPSEESLT